MLFAIAQGSAMDWQCVAYGVMVIAAVTFLALFAAYRLGFRRGRESVVRGERGFPVITAQPAARTEDKKRE
jgi:hypothetical protein